MYNNTLGLTRNTTKAADLKERYNTLSKVFHPDKVDPAYAETSRKLFIEILEDYQTYQNPLILSIVKIYGDDFGIELYNKYREQFELIQSHIASERLDMEQVLWIYRDEIEEIVEFIYYNNYANDAYWLDLNVHHQLALQGYKGESQLSMGVTKPLGSCVVGLNLGFSGSFEEEFTPDLNGSFTFYTYVLKKRVTNTIRCNLLHFKNLVFAAGYSLYGFNLVHELSVGHEVHNSHRVDYNLNENSLVRVNLVLAPNKVQYVISFINRFKITEDLTFKANLVLFKKAAKLKLAANYKINEMFKLVAEADIVQAYELGMAEYYKLENSFIGFATSIGSAKLKLGTSYRYTSFKEIELRLKYYRLNVTVPITLGESEYAAAWLLSGMAVTGLVIYFYKSASLKAQLIKGFKTAKNKIENISSHISVLTTKQPEDETAVPVKPLTLQPRADVSIQECYITLKAVSRFTQEQLKGRCIPAVDCKSLAIQMYEQDGQVDFDRLLKQIDAACDDKLSDLVPAEHLALTITYTAKNTHYRKILHQGGHTTLRALLEVGLLTRLLASVLG